MRLPVFLTAEGKARKAAALRAMEHYPASLKKQFCDEFGVGGQKPLRWWQDQMELIERNNGFGGSGRNKQPSVYTKQALDMALHLVAESSRVYTAEELVMELQGLQMLPPGSHDTEWFTKQLKAYAKSVGTPITTGWIHTLSFLDEGDYALRVAFADYMLNLLDEQPGILQFIVFEDETSISKVPGPHGGKARKHEWRTHEHRNASHSFKNALHVVMPARHNQLSRVL